MSDTKILVVEDDSIIAEEIETVLKRAGYRVTAVTESCEATLEAARKEPPDLIFMDIRISGPADGVETARRLKETGNFPIIFLTNLHDKKTLERAIEVKPANYLAKPFIPNQLLISIEHALLNFAENREASLLPATGHEEGIIPLKDDLFIRDSNGGFKKKQISDILFIEASRAYCTIHTQDEKFVQSSSMAHIKEKMNHPHLVQVDRSHVVNINNIDRLKGNIVVVGDHEIKIGGQYRDDFLRHLNLVR